MSRSCCVKPIAKIIKVGAFEAGITGLEEAMKRVRVSGIEDEENVRTELLRLVKEFGNYISSGTEHDYEEALLREYRTYTSRIKREAAAKRSKP